MRIGRISNITQMPRVPPRSNQLDIFAEAEERVAVAKKYHVLDPNMIEKRGNIWYMRNSNTTPEEWDKANDNDGLKHWQK